MKLKTGITTVKCPTCHQPMDAPTWLDADYLLLHITANDFPIVLVPDKEHPGERWDSENGPFSRDALLLTSYEIQPVNLA